MKLSPLENQVGGHHGVLSMGEENEIVVKPCLPQELRFYEEAVLHPDFQVWMPSYYGTLTLTRELPQQLQGSQVNGQPAGGSEMPVPTVKALNGFLLADLMAPEFAPTVTPEAAQSADINKDESDAECICLENISHGFQKACLLDLKLGTQLFDEDASEDKKSRLGVVAANTTSGTLGMRLTGFHVYDCEKGEFIKYSKDYGKGLTDDTVLDGFRAFFSAKLGPQRMRLVIERFINDLADFLEMIETQEVRMRSSSLLLMYEGDPDAFDEGYLTEQEKIAEVVTKAKIELEKGTASISIDKDGDRVMIGNNNNKIEDDDDDDDDDDDEDDDDEELRQKVTDMRLIDFGHSTWTPGKGPDEGVVLGVKSALKLLEKLLEDYPHEEEEEE
ncbi:hypothetical protein BGX21_001321 [Mortierella sp. AD011]|nr:hypothetical protein BGX20_003503 [Mortierella sp. AD010]KAF9384349.1 hypothetical protein BGX21_001321 [Mortierella sp. AD011]